MEQTNTFIAYREIDSGRKAIQTLVDQINIEATPEDNTEIPPDVWEMLIHQYTPMLKACAFRLLGTDEMAQDIVQDTWMALYLQIRRRSLTWVVEANITAWLRTVIKNKALNYKKIQGRMSSLDAPTSPMVCKPCPASFDYPAEAAMREDVQRALYQAIKALRKPQREVIAYRFFYDCSLGEIVQTLDVPLNTVKDRLARAKKQLQRILLEGGVECGDLDPWDMNYV